MQELEKTIAGDWFDIKEHSENIYDVDEFFDFSADQIRALIRDIRFSVEEGVLEYKRKILNPVFSFLDTLKYDSKGFDQLSAQGQRLTPLLYALLIQRLIARGSIPLKRKKVEVEEKPNLEIKEIIKDINDRVQEDPDLKNNLSVKNILMQINIYKKELENMSKLAPNIPPEKKESFAQNYRKTFDEIYRSIQENYYHVIQDQQQKIEDMVSASPLLQYDIKSMSRLFLNQAGEVSRVRSSLFFAAKEGFKTREALVRLSERKRGIMNYFEEERKRYHHMTEGDEQKIRTIGKAFGTEIIYVLSKQLNRITPQEDKEEPSS